VRVPSVATIVTACAVVAIVLSRTVPVQAVQAVLATGALAALLGTVVGVGHVRLRATARTMARILGEDTAPRPVRWIEVTAQSRTVRLGRSRMDYPGLAVRSGVGAYVVEQRWLPGNGAGWGGDGGRLAARLPRHRTHR
jgi:hypothetical protein